jgi:uncharacterized protein
VNETLAQILELQDHDTNILKLNKDMDDLPARKADVEAHVESARGALDEAKAELQARQMGVDGLEVDVAAAKEKIARLQMQENQVKTNEEYRAIQKELFTLKQAIIKSEDQELELMESVEQQRAVVGEREAELKQQQEHISEDIEMIDERQADLQQELERHERERAVLREKIDPRWLAKYERILRQRGGAAIVPLAGDTCSACNMTPTPQTIQNAKRNSELVPCDHCGRFLYFPE